MHLFSVIKGRKQVTYSYVKILKPQKWCLLDHIYSFKEIRKLFSAYVTDTMGSDVTRDALGTHIDRIKRNFQDGTKV